MASSRFRRSLLTLALFTLAALAAPAVAQTTPAPAGAPGSAPAAAPPPAAPSEELPPPPPPPSYAEPTADADTCTPACRSGFTCRGGQCISQCNPPCAAGEQCTPQGECVLSSGGGAPSFPVPEDMGPAPRREGFEQHDGFMLRLAVGFGGAGATLDPKEDAATRDLLGFDLKYDFSGGAFVFSLDIGGAPTDNLIIHARMSDFAMIGPKVEIAGDSGELDGSLASHLLGIGLTYYFMPVNLYLTAVIGAGWLTLDPDTDDDEDSRATDMGVGFEFDVGKEWWVSDNWGLGLAGRFSLSSGTTENENTDIKSDFAMLGFGLLFSATYN